MPLPATSPAFHADDLAEAGDYRTLSVLAVISLVIGVTAPLAIVAPLLYAIPIVGIALSLLALARIANSGGTLTGSWAAKAGLVLCVASLVAPVSRTMVSRAIRIGEAKKVSRNWLEVLTAGDAERAFRFTADGLRRQAPAPPTGLGNEPLPTAEPKKTPYEIFLDEPATKALKAMGAEAQIRYEGTSSYEAATYRNITMHQRYTVTPASGGKPLRVDVTMQRATLPGESMSRWLVVHCADADAPPKPNPAG